MMLKDRILKLKQDTSSITENPVLNAFELSECESIDVHASTDKFVEEKRKLCLNNLSELLVDFASKYKQAYEEYNEAVIYIALTKKFTKVERVPEGATKTPDLQIRDDGEFPFQVYAEVKALSFLDGDLNYKEAQQSGVAARIDIEQQLAKGKRIAFGTTVISPFLKNKKAPTTRELIEIYINKITQNIKRDQYSLGETVLIVDIKQLLLGSNWDDSAVSIYMEYQFHSIASGVLWNAAFGKVGHPVYRPIEFEGKPNTDGELAKNGVLVENDCIKALVFVTYKNFTEPRYIGFIRTKDIDTPAGIFTSKLCSFYNDEENSEAWRVLGGGLN